MGITPADFIGSAAGSPSPSQVVGLVADGAAVEKLLPVHFNARVAKRFFLSIGIGVVSHKHVGNNGENGSAGKRFHGTDNSVPNQRLVESHHNFVEEFVGSLEEGKTSLGFGDQADGRETCDGERSGSHFF